MPKIDEGGLAFVFPDDWQAIPYDVKGSFYREHFQKFANTHKEGGNKAVDIVAFSPEDENLWLIEIKDYRAKRREKELDIFVEVAIKVRDTLACLYLAQRRSGCNLYSFAQQAAEKSRIRVALHLEQPKNPSREYPLIVQRDNARRKLKQAVGLADPHPWFCEMGKMPLDCPWNVIPKN